MGSTGATKGVASFIFLRFLTVLSMNLCCETLMLDGPVGTGGGGGAGVYTAEAGTGVVSTGIGAWNGVCSDMLVDGGGGEDEYPSVVAVREGGSANVAVDAEFGTADSGTGDAI